MSKYKKAKQLIERITETDDTIDCEQILRNSNDWALNQNQFNAKQEFEIVLNSNQNSNKDSFLYSIISFLFNELTEKKESINEEKYSLSSCETSDESGQSRKRDPSLPSIFSLLGDFSTAEMYQKTDKVLKDSERLQKFSEQNLLWCDQMLEDLNKNLV